MIGKTCGKEFILMRNKFLGLGVLIILLTAPAVALSDCVDLGRANNQYIQGAHAVIFYAGMKPVARVEVPYCMLYQDSIIRLTRTYACDGDQLVVDGGLCIIGTLSSATTNPMY